MWTGPLACLNSFLCYLLEKVQFLGLELILQPLLFPNKKTDIFESEIISKLIWLKTAKLNIRAMWLKHIIIYFNMLLFMLAHW